MSPLLCTPTLLLRVSQQWSRVHTQLCQSGTEALHLGLFLAQAHQQDLHGVAFLLVFLRWSSCCPRCFSQPAGSCLFRKENQEDLALEEAGGRGCHHVRHTEAGSTWRCNSRVRQKNHAPTPHEKKSRRQCRPAFSQHELSCRQAMTCLSWQAAGLAPGPAAAAVRARVPLGWRTHWPSPPALTLAAPPHRAAATLRPPPHQPPPGPAPPPPGPAPPPGQHTKQVAQARNHSVAETCARRRFTGPCARVRAEQTSNEGRGQARCMLRNR